MFFDGVEDMKVSNLLEVIDRYCADNSIPNVDKDVGKLFSILIKTSRSKNILELGTCVGYSTIWLALAAKENRGNVLTIEKDIEILQKPFKQQDLTFKIREILDW